MIRIHLESGTSEYDGRPIVEAYIVRDGRCIGGGAGYTTAQAIKHARMAVQSNSVAR